MILRQRHLSDVVVDDVAALYRLGNRAGISDVAGHELDAVRTVGGLVEVEHADTMATLHQPVDEQRSEVATASGDETRGHSSSPSARHHRILRRMPSNSAISGW